MLKFGSLERWIVLGAGTAIIFPVARRVRLEVSTPEHTDWTINGEYLCTTSGRESIEVTVPAGAKFEATETARYRCIDGETAHYVTGNPSFAKIANRRARNPEMERIAAIAAENATRRMAQMHAEERRQWREQQAAEVNRMGGTVDNQTGEIHEDGEGTGGGRSGKAVAKEAEANPKPDSAGSGGEEAGAGSTEQKAGEEPSKRTA